MTRHIACWWGPKNLVSHTIGMGAGEYCETAYSVGNAVNLLTMRLGKENSDIEECGIASNGKMWVSWYYCDCENDAHEADRVESTADPRHVQGEQAANLLDMVRSALGGV